MPAQMQAQSRASDHKSGRSGYSPIDGRPSSWKVNPFLLSQFFQTVQGYSPLGSGLRILPWTIMPMFVAPIAGALSDRIGGARLMGIGLTLQAAGLASLAAISTPTTPYWELVAPFMVSGLGM